MSIELNSYFANRSVLVTGGVGFIGSNLVRRLIVLGAKVTVVDSLLEGQGGNLFNLEGVRDRISLSISDLRDSECTRRLVYDQDLIFNLAGQVSHEDSMRDPMTDLDLNCRSHISLLEACRENNRGARIIFTGTRQVYGRPRYLPVDENHPLQPIDANGINKLAAEQYHLLYHQVYGIWTSILRLSNTYGPRQLIRHSRQGFIGWFVRKALRGETIAIYGDGQQLRDLNYVDDVVEALLSVAAHDSSNGQIFNLGGEVVTLLELVRILGQFSSVSYEIVPFPEERRSIDIGSYSSNCNKISSTVGWSPQVSLREGLRRMLDFYRQFGGRYE